MIERLAAAFLALGASLGGLYGGVTMAVPSGVTTDAVAVAPTSNYRTELVATPMIVADQVRGYVIGRYFIDFDAARAEMMGTPLTQMIGHAINGYFFRHAHDMFWVGGPLTAAAIADGLTEAINEAAGYDLVRSIAIRQLDYLQSPEIRQPVIAFDR